MAHPLASESELAPDYQEFLSAFSVESLNPAFSADFDKGMNAAIECCDRYAKSGRIALYWEGQDGRSTTHTFEELKEASSRFANFLVSQGVQPGDRVAGLLPRVPELLVVILGTWRAGAVYQPLFTAFGPKAIEYRVSSSEAKLIVTDSTNRPKLDEVANCPAIATITSVTAAKPLAAGDFDFRAALASQSASFAPVLRSGDDPFMMLFTSGTTGQAKGVAVPNKALKAFYMYMRYAVDLRADDVYWNIADPGWAYGLYYAAIGPLLMGHATLFYEGSFTVDSTYRVIQKYNITNLAGAPTAYRMLIATGPDKAKALSGRLRVANSAGEPLNPEVIRWFREHLACTVNDHYGQTEIGMVLCNFHGLRHAVRAGAAGYAVPGYRMVVVSDEGVELPPGQQGNLAVDREMSSLYYFEGYWRQATPSFVGKYYLTGDTVEMDASGNIAFVGRGDDIITSAGYRIGPFDVESCLIEHPAVAETAVIGKPDPERTEIVKAFVVLKQGFTASDALAAELQQLVKHRLAAHAYPREVQFVLELPKTPSGKIQRFLLRQQEAGTPAR
jgi:acetyl-CoA synthetase